MAKKEQDDKATQLLEQMMILELLKNGVPQHDIRKHMVCDIHQVSKLAKLLKKGSK